MDARQPLHEPLSGRSPSGLPPMEIPAVLQPASPADNVVRLWGPCPWSETVTAYDRRNIYIYGWLLDGQCAGVNELEMARVVFRIDADRQPDRAARVVRTHLQRAYWLYDNHLAFRDW
ncbi:MAG: hypothetical protein WDM91_02055 [Rhizomicrobium sp.]